MTLLLCYKNLFFPTFKIDFYQKLDLVILSIILTMCFFQSIIENKFAWETFSMLCYVIVKSSFVLWRQIILFFSFLFLLHSRFCFLTSDKLILGQILLILLSGELVYQNHSVKCFLYFAEKNCQWQTRFKVDVWFGLECCRARVWTSWI